MAIFTVSDESAEVHDLRTALAAAEQRARDAETRAAEALRVVAAIEGLGDAFEIARHDSPGCQMTPFQVGYRDEHDDPPWHYSHGRTLAEAIEAAVAAKGGKGE